MYTIQPKRENRQIEQFECINVTIRPNDKPWYDSEIRMFSKNRDRQYHLFLTHLVAGPSIKDLEIK